MSKHGKMSFSVFEEPLQFAAVFLMAVLFIFGHTIGILLSIYVFLTPLYSFIVIYLVWTYCFDLKTPAKGGRRSETFRRLKSWEYFRDYFPARLIRTKRLDPKRNYILGYHPHGIMCAGAWVNFATEATGFSDLFPGIKSHLLTLKRKSQNFRLVLEIVLIILSLFSDRTEFKRTLTVMFKFPFWRDFVMAGGVCDVSKESIRHIVSKNGTGNAAVIAIGGAAESLDARPGSYTLTLKNRKGFVRMALQTGAYLVPVFSFGENELFNQVSNPRGSRLRAFQNKLMKILSFAPPLFFGRGILPRIIGIVPYRRPVCTVVGAPIPVKRAVANPSPQQVNRLHKKYVQGLINLFDEQKHRYGLPRSVKLRIV